MQLVFDMLNRISVLLPAEKLTLLTHYPFPFLFSVSMHLTSFSVKHPTVTIAFYLVGGTAAAAPPPSGLATLPSVGAVP